MDYEKAYLEAIERAKAGKPMDEVFPELKESEDERIRKNILALVKKHAVNHERCQMEAYLEKQKEQKPAEWSEDFEENIRNLLHDKLTGHSEDGSMSWTTLIDDKTLKDIVNGIWFYVGKEALKYLNKELSQPEWSEEDEKYLNLAINIVASDFGADSPTVSWLKSLRTQPHWKPSKEQMEALHKTVCGDDHLLYRDTLIGLYQQLKQL